MRFSNKVDYIEESFLNKWDSKVKNRIDGGEEILRFNLGQPDFPCPEFVKKAIKDTASLTKNNFYNHTGGVDGARREIALLREKSFGVKYEKDEVIVTNGAKEAIFLALAAILDAGDEVIIIAPAWPTYIEAVKFLGGKAVVLKSDDGFHLDIGMIKDFVSERTKAIIINSPNNPTGVVYTEQELSEVARIARDNDLIVISDEVYDYTVFDGKEHLSISRLPDMKLRTVVIDSFSKTLSIAGYRLGYAASSREMIDAMIKVKSNINGNTNSLLQMAMETVLRDYTDEFYGFVDFAHQEYLERRDFVCGKLEEMGIEHLKPNGSFYVFARIPSKSEMKSQPFAEYLLEKARVAVAPGIFFGTDYDDYFRISFGASMEDLEKGMEKMKQVL